MSSVDVQILGAAVEALRDADIVSDRVFEMRGVALVEDDLPAIDVALLSSSSTVLTIHGSALEHVTTLQLDVCVAEQLGESVARTADAAMLRAHQVMVTDASIAALVQQIRLVGREWIDERAAGHFLRVRMSYEIEHFTQGDDLSVAL